MSSFAEISVLSLVSCSNESVPSDSCWQILRVAHNFEHLKFEQSSTSGWVTLFALPASRMQTLLAAKFV